MKSWGTENGGGTWRDDVLVPIRTFTETIFLVRSFITLLKDQRHQNLYTSANRSLNVTFITVHITYFFSVILIRIGLLFKIKTVGRDEGGSFTVHNV